MGKSFQNQEEIGRAKNTKPKKAQWKNPRLRLKNASKIISQWTGPKVKLMVSPAPGREIPKPHGI